MPVIGIGLDVVDAGPFAEQLGDPASGFVTATYRTAERRNLPAEPARRVLHLAGRFAAKEAFVKAWSSTRRGQPPALQQLDLRDIEVVEDGFGRPALRLHGEVRAALPDPAPTLHLSISHDGAVAAAVVVLEVELES